MLNRINALYDFIASFLILLLCFTFLSACDLFNDESGFEQEPGPILFISDESGTEQLYSLAPDGTDVRQLTSDPGFPITDAVWSPDGSRIVLVSSVGGDRTYGPALYIVNADGTGRRKLFRGGNSPNSASGQHPVWSPDGRQLVFQRLLVPEALGIYAVFMVNVDGTGLKSFGDVKEDFPRVVTDWSQDGATLLGHTIDPTARDSAGRATVYDYVTTWNVAGDSLFAFGGEIGEGYTWPVWSSSNQAIALRILRDRTFELYRASATGTDLVQLTNDEFDFIIPVAWSPDDKHILAKGTIRNQNRRFRDHIVMVDASRNEVLDLSPFSEEFHNRPTSWLAIE